MNKNKKHWLVVSILCGFTACFSIPINLTGVFLSPVATELGFQRGDFSFHATLTLFISAIVSLYVPRLMEKISLKYILILAALLSSIPNIMMGFADKLWEFNLLGSVRGVGVGLISMVPVAIIINHWFHKHHGMITSIVLSFSGLSGALMTPVFANLIEQFGWRNSYFISGVVIIILLLPGILIPFTVNPASEGLEPLGAEEVLSEDLRTKGLHLAEKLFDKKVFFALMLMAVLHTAIIGLGQHFPGFADANGHGAGVGALMLSVAMVGSIFFKMMVGAISDRLNAVTANLLMITISLVSVVVFISKSGPTLLLVAAFFFGAAYSIPAVGLPLLTKELLGKHYFNKVFPIISFGLATSGAVSISLIGYLFDFSGSYTLALLFTIGINIANIFLLVVMMAMTKKPVNRQTLSL